MNAESKLRWNRWLNAAAILFLAVLVAFAIAAFVRRHVESFFLGLFLGLASFVVVALVGLVVSLVGTGRRTNPSR